MNDNTTNSTVQQTFQSPQRHSFGDQLRHRIKATGKTQKQISQFAGIEESTLSRFMNDNGGLTLPVLESVIAVCDLCEEVAELKRQRKSKSKE